MTDAAKAPILFVALALGAVYVVWGSTYLAIFFAIESIPPFTMAGVRFTIAGTLLYAFMRFRGQPRPLRRHWVSAGLVGALLLTVANGGVTWAEQRVPSGVAALIVTTVPVWMVVFDWLRPAGARPTLRVVLGLTLGLAGVMLLIAAGQNDFSAARIDLVGAGVLLLAALSWAFGSILSRSLSVPKSTLQLTSMQMIVGGLLLLVVGAASGELTRLDIGGITRRSLLAFGYLVVFGSWVGYGAYVWLLRATTPAVVATYAYVNPAIAVLLGWALADETIDGWMLAAMAVTIVGVALITMPKRPGGSRRARRGGPEGTDRPSGRPSASGEEGGRSPARAAR